MASRVGCKALGLLGSWQLSLPTRLTWDSQNLRGWIAKDWVATPEALSKMKRTSSVFSEPQRTNRPIAHAHKSVYASADIRERSRLFLRLLRDNRKTPCFFKVIAR